MKNFKIKALKAAVSGALLVLALPAAMAADPDSGTLNNADQVVNWDGETVGSNPNACIAVPTRPPLVEDFDPNIDPACDHYQLNIQPAFPGETEVVVHINSTGELAENDDYDLFVFDPDGNQIGASTTSGADETVKLINPSPGTYLVEAQAWLVQSPEGTYSGDATLRVGTPGFAPNVTASAEQIFATPTLMDSQLHTGEPSIAVSPVIPEDGSRPLIVGDAPWGTSNATSLWWRSRDGGESYELVQDPVAAPRPRPCEEIDGGGDSDTAFDRHGNIYVNDLAALINITVGHSHDDFQTMNCTKAGGTNPLQPIQDRQWIVASDRADGPAGDEIDAFITFRRGLINGTPATETAIQIYETRDGGQSYTFAGELTDFFGFDNAKVSQTGNPVQRNGILWQAYYLTNTPKVGRYDPYAATDEEKFKVFEVAQRETDVGNVFPTLAIDDAGVLYYAWVEGGGFDVMFTRSLDEGVTWSEPIRVNATGESELAVNPYMVAGSEGRVAVLFNATENAASPDAANGKAWNLYVSQSLNANEGETASFTQYKVTDTPLHFNSICTSGLNCTISGGDRSLLEFNEVDIDPMDGSMVFIFADNGRLQQPPLSGADIPQPYIMATRQIAGDSMIAGKAVLNTLPRTNFAQDREGDSTYPKAGTAEGPQHPVMDILFSRLVATDTGVRAYMTMTDLSDLAEALDVTFGLGDPRTTDKAIWVTRFEINEQVFALGMDIDKTYLVPGAEPTFWYGTPGVARSSGIKRSSYGRQGDHTFDADVGFIDGDTVVVEIPYEFMGIDPADKPVFHSVVSFALVQPDGSLDVGLGLEDHAYFNNQRTVDASKAYDWTLGDPTPLPPNEDEDSDDDDFDDDGSRDDSDSDDDNDGRKDDADSDDDNDGRKDDNDSDDDNDGISDDHDSESTKDSKKSKHTRNKGNSSSSHAMDVDAGTLLLIAVAEGAGAENLRLEIYNPAGVLVATSIATPGKTIATAVPLGGGIYEVKVSNPTNAPIDYELKLISRSNWL